MDLQGRVRYSVTPGTQNRAPTHSPTPSLGQQRGGWPHSSPFPRSNGGCARRIKLRTRSAQPNLAWHPVDEPLVWQGTEADAVDGGALFAALNPTWKVMLLSDGSVTRHLQLLTNDAVKVECFEMRELPADAEHHLPFGKEQIAGPLLQRQLHQVFLRTAAEDASASSGLGPPLVYAASWWNADEARKYLHRQEQPIWVSLQGTELRRDIKMVYYGGSSYLEEAFGESGPFWGRHYIFWNEGKPLTVIYEVFSPKLQQFLGPFNGKKRS